jgi:hypothetical protein
MRILLDECVPWPIHKLLVGHECVTVPRRGWGGIKNGELLRLAEPEFDLFLTADQNIRYQAEPRWSPHRDSRTFHERHSSHSTFRGTDPLQREGDSPR